jgi:hypothetical protein
LLFALVSAFAESGTCHLYGEEAAGGRRAA